MSKRRRSVDPEFVDWLQSEKNLKERSSRDVKSHLLRADEIIDVDDMTLREPEVTYGLSKSEKYQELPLPGIVIRKSITSINHFKTDT